VLLLALALLVLLPLIRLLSRRRAGHCLARRCGTLCCAA
jgi:hypothetical protein